MKKEDEKSNELAHRSFYPYLTRTLFLNLSSLINHELMFIAFF